MGSPNLTVRKREAAHLDACVEVLELVHVADGYPDTWPDDPAIWLSSPTLRAAWVAVQSDSVVGHVVLETESDTSLKVSRLFVSPSSRGNGAAEALLAAAASFADDHACTAVLDVVEESVAAIALYERLGWEFVGSRAADWIMRNGSRPIERRYVKPDAAQKPR